MNDHPVSQSGDANLFHTVGPGVVALVDDRPLRRSFVSNFLDSILGNPVLAGADPGDIISQADAKKLEPVPTDAPTKAATKPTRKRAESVSIAIVSCGGESLTTDGNASSLISETVAAFPGAPVLIISDLEAKADVMAAFKLGVQGYVSTRTNDRVMLAAIQLVQAGGQYAPPRVLLDLAEEVGGGQDKPQTKSQAASTEEENMRASINGATCHAEAGGETEASEQVHLSNRESEVLSHIRQGFQNKQIAYRLNMSESTVKVHVRHVMKKLGVTNRTQAAFRARNLVLPEPDPPRQATSLAPVCTDDPVGDGEIGFDTILPGAA